MEKIKINTHTVLNKQDKIDHVIIIFFIMIN